MNFINYLLGLLGYDTIMIPIGIGAILIIVLLFILSVIWLIIDTFKNHRNYSLITKIMVLIFTLILIYGGLIISLSMKMEIEEVCSMPIIFC